MSIINNSLSLQNVSNKFRQRSTKGQIPYIELDGEQVRQSKIIRLENASWYKIGCSKAITLQVPDTHFIIKRLKKEFERVNKLMDNEK